MKTRFFPYVTLLVGLLLVGCSRTPESAAPVGTCRIQQSTTVTQSKYAVTNQQTNYTYDAQGNLLTVDAVSKKNDSPFAQTGTVTTAHTYDPNGYLTQSTTGELYVTTTPDRTIREQISTTQSYSYTSGRLSAYTKKRIGAYGLTTVTNASFVYDQAGLLITKTEQTTTVVHDATLAKEIPATPVGSQRIWTYQANKLVDYVEKSGTVEQRPLAIQNGNVSRITGPNYEVRYAYDTQQRLTRQENYVDGQLKDYYTHTWTDAKAAVASLPPFRGFPPSEIAVAGVSATYRSFFLNQATGTMQLFNDDVYTIQTNGQGFVTSVVIRSTHPTATDQDYSTTETYIYSGCQ